MMKTITLILALLLITATTLIAQETAMKRVTKIDLGFSGLDISHELPLSEKFLLEGAVGLGAGYHFEDDNFNYAWNFAAPSAFLTLHGKYYYNRHKRLAKEKSLDFNSGTFVGLKAKYTTGEVFNLVNENYSLYRFPWEKNREALLIALHWGFQYKIGKRWSYEFYVGLGYAQSSSYYSSSKNTIYPDANIRFSYILPL